MTTYITTEFTGQSDIRPRRVKIKTTDSFAVITTAGYLNKLQRQGYNFFPDDFFDISYGDNVSQTFTVAISDGVYTLEPSAGDVVLPVVANHIAVYSGTGGALTDNAATAINGGNLQAGLSGTAGTLASFPATAAKGSLKVTAVANTGDTVTTISNAAMGQASVVSIPDPGAATANFILNKSSGSTQTIETGLSITGSANNVQTTGGGNFIAGSSGAAGSLFSYPATASKGSLEIRGADNTGNTDTVITNATMGQASVITIPDPAAATANFAVAPAALVNNNLVKASGTAGLVADAGARIISNTTAAYGGGGTTNQFVATGLTVAAKGTAVIRASTNSVSITKALPGTDTLDITFSADPGASTTVDYIYTTAAMS